MKRQLILSAIIMLSMPFVHADNDYEDDIYYNPKTSKNKTSSNKKSNYIADMSNMDVDTYNRRGQYYSSPIDTIGAETGNGEDFVYTRQIQKYYNPTIVVENSDILADILDNAYGNVDIVINNGYPTMAPIYISWPYYSYRWTPGFNFGWGWGGWGWNLSWNIGWYDPWFGWNSPWTPGWCHGWGWGPGFRPHPVHHMSYRPSGRRPSGAGGGWSYPARPGHNYNGNVNTSRRPGNNGNYHPNQSNSARPSGWGTSTATGRGERGNGTSNYRRPTSTSVSRTPSTTSNRNPGTSTTTRPRIDNSRNVTTQPTNTGRVTTGGAATRTERTTGRSSDYNSSNNRQRNSNSSFGTSNRNSSGSSFGTGNRGNSRNGGTMRSGGGAGRGRHR